MVGTAKDVDRYIAKAPKNMQAKLRQVRAIIKSMVPNSVEGISYKMPTYDNGKIVWFAAMNKYIGLYFRPPIIEEHKRELAGYKITKSAVHIPIDKKVPVALIKKLIKARIVRNKSN